ncbi:hypothetical protein RCL_jg3490.t1 [Rhizophagus clarus]|uniref:Uncharacterized protein n=1 Tax=Rhizophagus clarus TaxID=94130 RepID=A0A8H3M2V3_9GLOM|nr:hypothetical protein RCL_jg3490.t1 [Rhizophagus clarus]
MFISPMETEIFPTVFNVERSGNKSLANAANAITELRATDGTTTPTTIFSSQISSFYDQLLVMPRKKIIDPTPIPADIISPIDKFAEIATAATAVERTWGFETPNH